MTAFHFNFDPFILEPLGNVEATQFLIERGADVNKCNELGASTPLHTLAQSPKPVEGRLGCAKLLIAAGAAGAWLRNIPPNLSHASRRLPYDFLATPSLTSTRYLCLGFASNDWPLLRTTPSHDVTPRSLP